MKEAADTLARDGIRILTHTKGEDTRYAPHGRPPDTPAEDVISKRSVESVVRANIITSINQEAASVTLSNCRELECDLVEVSEHVGARPEHEAWQGKVYSLSGESKKYPPFSVCGYGEADGICGINCRHSFYPYFEEELTEGEKAELDRLHESIEDGNKEVYTYTHIVNGEEREEHCSRYEAEQVKRGLERKVREWKRREDIKEVLDVDATREKAKVRQWKRKLYDFEEETGLDSIAGKGRLKIGEGKIPINKYPSNMKYDSYNAKNIELKLNDIKDSIGIVKGNSMTFREANNKKINPQYDSINNSQFVENCQSCNPVLLARLRGYNIKALPYNENNKYMKALEKDLTLAYIDSKTNTPPRYIDTSTIQDAKQLYSFLTNTIKDNEVYSLDYCFIGDGEYMGHVISAIRDNKGQFFLYDGQSSRVYKEKGTIENYLSNISFKFSARLFRIDNLLLNKDYIQNISEVTNG